MKHYLLALLLIFGFAASGCAAKTAAPDNGVSEANARKALVSASNGLELLRPRLEEIVSLDTRTALLKRSMITDYKSVASLISAAIVGNK